MKRSPTARVRLMPHAEIQAALDLLGAFGAGPIDLSAARLYASALGRSLILDSKTRTVNLDGVDIPFTPKEFDLLEYLAHEPGTVFRRSDILRDVWQTTWYGTTKTLDAHVASIRKKLGDAEWIESVRGVGFALKAVR